MNVLWMVDQAALCKSLALRDWIVTLFIAKAGLQQ
jgi:hypothetical protein